MDRAPWTGSNFLFECFHNLWVAKVMGFGYPEHSDVVELQSGFAEIGFWRCAYLKQLTPMF